jgi:hypothetical protein
VQLQNLTRGSLPYKEVLAVICYLSTRDLDWLRLACAPWSIARARGPSRRSCVWDR